MMFDVVSLLKFAREREMIRFRREVMEKPRPWTSDPILATYRFCNVCREDDKVTRWIRDNWRTPNGSEPFLWFAMLVARFINWPPTLAELGFPIPWNPKHFIEVMSDRKRKGEKVYGNAYMIRSDSTNKGGDKFVYQEKMQFTPMWEQRGVLCPKPTDTLNSYHMLLGQFYGLSSFMAAQVVADLKYVSPLREARDWKTFAASGPGSRRGLNRVMGRAIDTPWSEEGWRSHLDMLFAEIRPMLADYKLPDIHAQDLQNVLCEFDKYERARLGQGRPKEKLK